MLKRFVPFLLALALLAGCSGPASTPSASGGSGSAAGGSSQPSRKVSLVLDWYPNAAHSFILAAEQEGFFKAEGLEVEIKMPAENPTDGIRLVAAGRETFALYYQPDVLLARAENIPIVSVAAIVRRPLNGIIVPTASGIRSPRDLEGKKIGYPGIPLNVHMVETMVQTAGGDPKKVTMTDVSWDLIPAITTRRVDAIARAYVNHEKPILEKEGLPVTYFDPTDFGVPNYYELVLITGEATAKKERALIDSFWRALARGHAWVKQNEAAAITLLLAKQNQSFPLKQDVEEASLKMLLPRMEEPGVAFGAQKKADWQKVAAWMGSRGALKKALKGEDAFVPVIP